MGLITLITGGVRSGKSRHALALASGFARRAFVATAEPFDEEMRERIGRHRAVRGDAFLTVEEPCDIAGALTRLDPGTEVAVVDCLTVWLANLMHRQGPDQERYPEVDALFKALETPPCRLILVSNEIGMGIVPENPMARRFRDLAGAVNQQIAALADEVVLMVSGIPVTIKKR